MFVIGCVFVSGLWLFMLDELLMGFVFFVVV